MEHESTVTSNSKIFLYYIRLEDKIKEGELHKCVHFVQTQVGEDILTLKSLVAYDSGINQDDLKVFPMVAPVSKVWRTEIATLLVDSKQHQSMIIPLAGSTGLLVAMPSWLTGTSTISLVITSIKTRVIPPVPKNVI